MSKLKLMTIVGTRPEIIRLAAVIKKCDKYINRVPQIHGESFCIAVHFIPTDNNATAKKSACGFTIICFSVST